MPVSPPLTVKESDDSVTVRPANVLSFNAADFTVAGSGDTATISIDATGTGASLTDTYVGFGNVSNLMTGSADLTWDDTAKELRVAGDGDNDGVIVITGTETLAGEGPKLEIRNTSGTDSFVKLYTDNYNVSYMDGGVPGGTTRNIWKSGQLSADTFITTFNNDALPADFQIKGDTNDNLFYADGGQDNVGIGGAPPSTTERLHVTGSGTADMVVIESTDAGSATAPDIVFYRSSVSPAANDYLGRIDFRGKDSAGADLNYGVIAGQIADPTNLSEDGVVLIKAAVNGDTNLTQPNASFKASGTTFNDGGLSALDFLVKGDNDNVIFVDAGLDNCGIGTSAPSSDVERLHVKGTGSDDVIVRIESTEALGDAGPIIELYRNATGVDDKDIGNIFFTGNDDGGTKHTFAKIRAFIRDAGAGGEDGLVIFETTQFGGDATEFLRFGLDTGESQREVVINNNSSSAIDFRVVTDNNANMIRTSGVNDNVGIGAAPVANAADAGGQFQVWVQNETGYGVQINRNKAGSAMDSPLVFIKDDSQYADETVLHVEGDGTSGQTIAHFKGSGTDNTVVIQADADSNSAAPDLVFYRTRVGQPGEDDDYIAQIDFVGLNDNATPQDVTYGKWQARIADASDGSEDGLLYYYVMKAGTLTRMFLMSSGGMAVNPDGNDWNFSHEFSGGAVGIMSDAGLSKVGVGAVPASGGAELQVNNDASFLLPVNAFTANHDITAEQAHGWALQMKTGAGTGTFTLPLTGVIGMHVTCINFGSGMNVAVAGGSSHKINGGGSAGNSTTATVTAAGARYDLVYIAADTWNCTAPAVVTAS